MNEKKIVHESVLAQPMRLHEFNARTGYCLDDRPDVDGYVVRNGNNETWYEKELFKEKYMTGMPFGMAIEALKKSKRVARAGWNGKGMYLVLVGGGTANHPLVESGGEVQALPSIGMWTVNSDGRRAFLTGWLASQTDMLADDWMIAE